MKRKPLLMATCIALIAWLIWFSNQPSDNIYAQSFMAAPAPIKVLTPSLPTTHNTSQNTAVTPIKVSAPKAIYNTHVKVDIPPITPSTPRLAFNGDLDDHDAYLNYESAQDFALKTAYIQAAKEKVKLLNSWLAKGIEAELEQSQLEFAREKISALEQLANALEEELKKAS